MKLPKLYIYSKIKSELKLQNYLLFFLNFKMRQLFTKFRVSDYSLEIESGRYKNITREERKCKNCNLNEIGDEYHFFLKCTANHSLRNNLFNKIIINKPDFIEEIPLIKIKILLDANSELLAEVGDFIKQSTMMDMLLFGEKNILNLGDTLIKSRVDLTIFLHHLT